METVFHFDKWDTICFDNKKSHMLFLIFTQAFSSTFEGEVALSNWCPEPIEFRNFFGSEAEDMGGYPGGENGQTCCHIVTDGASNRLLHQTIFET